MWLCTIRKLISAHIVSSSLSSTRIAERLCARLCLMNYYCCGACARQQTWITTSGAICHSLGVLRLSFIVRRFDSLNEIAWILWRPARLFAKKRPFNWHQMCGIVCASTYVVDAEIQFSCRKCVSSSQRNDNGNLIGFPLADRRTHSLSVNGWQYVPTAKLCFYH